MNKPKRKIAGQPTKYSPEFEKQAYKLSLLGATDKEIGDFLEVTETTINNWKKAHPLFFESIKMGKSMADAMVVKSLYRRALGYSHKEDKIFVDKGAAIIVPTRKYYPPDTLACIYWLNNRRPQDWRNVKEDDIAKEPVKMPIIIVKHKKK